MKCLDCPLKYAGQVGKAFRARYKEHIQAIRNNNSNSGYTTHKLNTEHRYGTLMDIMHVIRAHRKRKQLKTLEKFHIKNISK
jgi:hypothetical protein